MWTALGKVVAVGLGLTVLLVVAFRAQDLLRMLIVSVFFALAIVPAVNFIHERWGWRRGAAVGAIYAGLILFVLLMVLVLIPGIAEFAQRVGESGGEWIADLNAWTEDTFGSTLIDQTAADEAAGTAESALREWGDDILGFAARGIGLIFNLATIALFTFYLAADYNRIDRAVMSRMTPHR